MAKRIPEEELQAIEAVVRRSPDGIALQDIARELETDLPRRTLQYRLKYLVGERRLVKKGGRRWATYEISTAEAERKAVAGKAHDERADEIPVPISKSAAKIQKHVSKPVEARKPVGYNREFLPAKRQRVPH